MAGVYEQTRKGNAVLEKLGGRIADREPEESVREAYDERPRRSDDDLMLDVRFSDGSRSALNYGYLVRIDYQPSDQLKLMFGLDTVVVEGRRLLPLYELLRRHRAKYVQEGTAAEDGLKPEEAPHIDRINFEKGKEDA